MTWFKQRLEKTKDKQLDHTQSENAPALRRFGATSQYVGWVWASLHLPDTDSANRATRAHVLLVAALLLLGEVTLLFLTMPQALVPLPGAATDGDDTAESMTSITADGDGSYAADDEASVLAATTSENTISSGARVGLGVDSRFIAAVRALTLLCAVGLRRLVGKKVDVLTPVNQSYLAVFARRDLRTGCLKSLT